MKTVNEMQEGALAHRRFYYGLLGAGFIISNTIALALLVNVLCSVIGLNIYSLFYWIGVALLSIFIYPIFRQAKPRDKYIMLIVSVIVLIIAVSMAML